jgi:dihydrofolate synthase/folylpolyglutamate synthase
LVAGTNGKGSTSVTLATLLSSAGERVGLFTSPHLMAITERFRLNDGDISDELFVQAFHWVFDRVRDLELTRFEILTLMAVYIFTSGELIAPVDRLILEVGVGGRFDATNAIDHHLAVITRLGLDHMRLLGSTLAEIADNKFAIVNKGCVVVHAPLDPQLNSLQLQIQKQTHSVWHPCVLGRLEVEKGRSPVFHLHTEWGQVRLNLLGARGAENTLLALTAFAQLGFDPTTHLTALEHLRWPGRMEKIADQPCPIYLSGDHNEQGVKSLVELLGDFSYATVHVIAGIGIEKEIAPIWTRLREIPRAKLYLTETPFKGRRLVEYGEFLELADHSDASPWALWNWLRARVQPDDLVVITGSLYLVGEMRKEFIGAKN